MNAKKIWSMVKQTFSEFGEDKVTRLSAAMAYYAMFSIGPLPVIAVGIAGCSQVIQGGQNICHWRSSA
jgi:membrane protein